MGFFLFFCFLWFQRLDANHLGDAGNHSEPKDVAEVARANGRCGLPLTTGSVSSCKGLPANVFLSVCLPGNCHKQLTDPNRT